MTMSQLPFSIPTKLSPSLRLIFDYWQNLRRGENSVPFWDDVKLSSLPELSDRMMLVDVLEHPQRFRFNLIGIEIQGRYGAEIAGKFLDELEANAPFEFLVAQASATMEIEAPTFFAHGASTHGQRRGGYGRLLLPLWGNGRVEMILGAVVDLAT